MITSIGVASSYDYVPNYSKAPCRLQRKWAEHNSVHATNTTGKETVYKAPCDVRRKKKKAVPTS